MVTAESKEKGGCENASKPFASLEFEEKSWK